ncbi:hypothetical protein L3X38_027154 [Prunus dulcis]|uniref:Uncharacterized protein n=1 Tax=Prunus dulcis TaxID=3755 RepID=A0AAD4Z0W4_PRUDU|nr:hypothetical protein L3X38_027154 [Prunus dulcis]
MAAGGERNRRRKFGINRTQGGGDGRVVAEVTAGRWLRYERRERTEATAERDKIAEEQTRNGEEEGSGRFCRFIRLCATNKRIRRAILVAQIGFNEPCATNRKGGATNHNGSATNMKLSRKLCRAKWN